MAELRSKERNITSIGFLGLTSCLKMMAIPAINIEVIKLLIAWNCHIPVSLLINKTKLSDKPSRKTPININIPALKETGNFLNLIFKSYKSFN